MSWWGFWSRASVRPQAQARQRLGRESELLARRLLVDQGYMIEQANVRYPVGEIDLIARDGDTLCFIEVRSVSSDAWGGALATVTRPKQQRILRAVQWYLQRLPELPSAVRFDIVAVTWQADGPPRAELVRGAFEADHPSW